MDILVYIMLAIIIALLGFCFGYLAGMDFCYKLDRKMHDDIQLELRKYEIKKQIRGDK